MKTILVYLLYLYNLATLLYYLNSNLSACFLIQFNAKLLYLSHSRDSFTTQFSFSSLDISLHISFSV